MAFQAVTRLLSSIMTSWKLIFRHVCRFVLHGAPGSQRPGAVGIVERRTTNGLRDSSHALLRNPVRKMGQLFDCLPGPQSLR